MNPPYIKIIWWACLVVIFQGCAANKGRDQNVVQSSSKRPVISVESRISVAHEFFVRGRLQEMQGNDELAMDFYRIAFAYDSSSRELCFFLSEKYKERGLDEKALEFAMLGVRLDGDPKFREYKLLGEIFLRRGNLSQAVRYYEMSRALSENDRDVLYTLATIYEQEGKAIQQIEVLERLLPLVDYPERLVSKLASLLKSQGRYPELIRFYNHAWDETGYNLYGETLAGVYESLGLFNHFLDTYRLLLRNDPENAYYKVQLARTHLSLEQLDSAFVYYEDLVEQFPEKERFLFTYATLLYAKGEWQEAKEKFLILLQKQPENPTYHYYLGILGEILEDADLAELEYNKAIQLNGKVQEYWARLGLFHLKNDRYSQAIRLFKNMTSVHSNSAYSWYLLGLTYNHTAEYQEKSAASNISNSDSVRSAAVALRRAAEESLKKSLSFDSTDTRVLFELGVALERGRKIMESIAVFEKLIKFDSTNSAALNYLGYMLLEKNRQLDKAIALIEAALDIEPDNGAYLDSKGWWLYNQGRYTEAKNYIERALRSGTKDITILEHLALILEKLGDMESAREQWALILEIAPNHKLAQSKIY